jgi:2-furoyl-CoA dehydrogenase large subunit
MLHFEGDKDFGRPPAEVWAKLSDARFLVQCIPGGEVIGQPEPAVAVAKLRPGFSFVRGTLEVTIRVAEATPDTLVRLALLSKGIGASSDVESALSLTPQGDGTRLHWTADVKTLGGLLKMVPKGLIQGAAESVIKDVWTQVEGKLPR